MNLRYIILLIMSKYVYYINVFIKGADFVKKVILTFCAVMFFTGLVSAEQVTVEEESIVIEKTVEDEVVAKDAVDESEEADNSFVVVAKLGHSGDAVVDVQNMLTKMGFYIMPDGNFGHDTERAIKDFQRRLNIEQDGVVTNDLHRLLKYYSDKIVVDSDEPASYKQMLRMEATAYTTQDPGCGLYTARGNLLRKGLVAVDPRVIPLGTKLYIPSYGYAVADDTGGAIKGLRIDLAYDSRYDALQFGRRMITVYILE